MTLINQTQFLERLRFFNGQRLDAPDLQSIETFNREMRWLHNRTLHMPGIGSGFSVDGAAGDPQVTIGPGYAIDNFGREIILWRPQVEPVPPRAGRNGQTVLYALTAQYPDDASLCEAVAETRDGVCAPRGVIRLREEPLFCWIEMTIVAGQPCAKIGQIAEEIKQRRRLVLACIQVRNCVILSIDLSCRVSARCMDVPYIACGTATAASNGKGVVQVSTTSAGFVRTPCYMARLEPDTSSRTTLKHLQTYVKDSTATAFNLVVSDTQLTAAGTGSRIVWVGIEG